jgi:hypothetical protein
MIYLKGIKVAAKLEVLAGTVFGRLTVLGEGDVHVQPSGQRKRTAKCECVCGRVVEVQLNSLRSGHTESCGCLWEETIIAATTTHGEAAGRGYGYLYILWCGIKSRCLTKTNRAYANYGGRGICLFEPWVDDYAEFARYIRTELGERPKGASLDRINNAEGYAPGNLRWASSIQQNNNRRDNLLLAFQGSTNSLAAWAEKFNIPSRALYLRLFRYNWPIEKALTTPLRRTK